MYRIQLDDNDKKEFEFAKTMINSSKKEDINIEGLD